MFQYYPQVLSARIGLRERLPRIPACVERAHRLAAILREMPGVAVKPDPPQTNMMHIYLHGDRKALTDRALALAHDERVALFFGLRETEVPGWSMFELTVAEPEDTLSEDEIRNYFARVMAPSGELAVILS
jgi:hypothetical protein